MRMNTEDWRPWLLLALAVLGLVAVFEHAPVYQDPAYHHFVDTRAFFGIPNFMNVVSNVPFLIVGVAGFMLCVRRQDLPQRQAWAVAFTGIGLVGFGSAWYHWSPGNAALVWDRLPITLGFMGLLSALMGEYVGERVGRAILLPVLLVGALSIGVWCLTGDLRLYVWVQFMPLLLVPVMMLLCKTPWSHRWLLAVALGLYVMAKLCEAFDVRIFAFLGHTLSGHTIKHLFAAGACYSFIVMLKHGNRLPLPELAAETESYPVQ